MGRYARTDKVMGGAAGEDHEVFSGLEGTVSTDILFFRHLSLLYLCEQFCELVVVRCHGGRGTFSDKMMFW